MNGGGIRETRGMPWVSEGEPDGKVMFGKYRCRGEEN